METPWDPGIGNLMPKSSIKFYVKIFDKNLVMVKKLKRKIVSDFQFKRELKMNAVVVQSCAGCEMRNSANGPFQWSYHFTHNPDNVQVRRLARRNMARWSHRFNLFTGCLECLEVLMNIAVLMLDAP